MTMSMSMTIYEYDYEYDYDYEYEWLWVYRNYWTHTDTDRARLLYSILCTGILTPSPSPSRIILLVESTRVSSWGCAKIEARALDKSKQ